MKSKFDQFVEEVINSHEKIEVNKSSNDYLNYQTNKVIQNSIKGLKIASNFIKMGIAATIIAAPALAAAGGDLTTSKYQDEMSQVVKVAQEKGYITAKMGISIKENQSTGGRYDSFIPSENQADVSNKASCDVTITLSQTGDRVYMAHHDDIKDITAPTNEMQKKISREFLLLHEASHCQFESINEVFLIKGNLQLQKEVNYYFKHTVGSNLSDSPYLMLNENFADTYAAVQLLKIYGDTIDVKKVINQTSLERQDQDYSSSMSGRIDSHYTHFSLQEVLSKENLEKIKKTSDPKELRQIALEIANKGTFTVLSTYSEVLTSLFEQNSMIDSTLMSANNNSISTLLSFNTLSTKMSSNQSSSSPSFFQQLGNEVIQKTKLERTYGENKEVKLFSKDEIIKLREVSRDIFQDRYGNDFEKIDSISEQFKKYITSQHLPALDKKTDQSTGLESLEEKRATMLKSYEYRTKEIEGNGVLFDKSSVLKSIQSLRGVEPTKLLTPKPI